MKKQLLHPEGKNAIAMDITKYETLRTSFLACLKKKGSGSFAELLEEVETYMKKKETFHRGKSSMESFFRNAGPRSQKRDKKG